MHIKIMQFKNLSYNYIKNFIFEFSEYHDLKSREWLFSNIYRYFI